MQAVATPSRTIRSFVRRMGRVTKGQERALSELWPVYGIDWPCRDVSANFERNAPLIVEIGFGMGASLVEMASNEPEANFLGIEVYTAGVGSLLLGLEAEEVTNVRVINHDAVEVFEQSIADDSLAGINIFFPDPWPKKRHHKRRLIQSEFVAMVTSKLKPGGVLHCATDWEPYAWQMLEVLRAEPKLTNTVRDFALRGTRPKTKFERRGDKLGHGVWDLVFARV